MKALTPAQRDGLSAICHATDPAIGAKVSNRTEHGDTGREPLVYWQTARTLAELGLAETHTMESWVRLTPAGVEKAQALGYLRSAS